MVFELLSFILKRDQYTGKDKKSFLLINFLIIKFDNNYSSAIIKEFNVAFDELTCVEPVS